MQYWKQGRCETHTAKVRRGPVPLSEPPLVEVRNAEKGRPGLVSDPTYWSDGLLVYPRTDTVGLVVDELV